MPKRIKMLLSIVERDKGAKLIKDLKNRNIRLNFQTVGFGTAPTEMMDIFGLGSNDKDIVISLGAEGSVLDLMSNFGATFDTRSKYGGLMIVLNLSAASRVLTEILHFDNKTLEKGNETMKNEHQNNLIVISVNEGFSDEVMKAARKAGATGGTVIKGRLADIEQFAELPSATAEEEREMLLILAPLNIARQIMDDVNREFGLNTEANGTVFAIATEKAYKI